MQVDSHIHLSMFPMTTVREMILSTNQKWVMAGFDLKDWHQQTRIKAEFPKQVITCMGLHPWKVLQFSREIIEEQMLWLETHLHSEAQACGETGIDFYKDPRQEKKDLQLEIFLRHLTLSQKLQKPLVIHCVQAHELILQHLPDARVPGIVHGFSGSAELARRYINCGFKISVGRGVFNKGYLGLKETVKQLSITDLVVESDAVPDDHESSRIILLKVVEAIAQIKSLPLEAVLNFTAQTADEVFKIYG